MERSQINQDSNKIKACHQTRSDSLQTRGGCSGRRRQQMNKETESSKLLLTPRKITCMHRRERPKSCMLVFE